MPINKVEGGWKIANTKGVSPSKKAAQRRLRAIKASQRARKKSGVSNYKKALRRP
jgi:hypothetical protein|tara:strand:+ start:167 stop:331 length:165 start_codon:yes stop_codon:yes gene_type:complete